MAQNEVRVAWGPLSEFTKEVFMRAGMPPGDAATEAGALIWANLRGVDSHGVLQIPRYIENIDKGVMNPQPNIRVEKETLATLLIEADRALGPVVKVEFYDPYTKEKSDTTEFLPIEGIEETI